MDWTSSTHSSLGCASLRLVGVQQVAEGTGRGITPLPVRSRVASHPRPRMLPPSDRFPGNKLGAPIGARSLEDVAASARSRFRSSSSHAAKQRRWIWCISGRGIIVVSGEPDLESVLISPHGRTANRAAKAPSPGPPHVRSAPRFGSFPARIASRAFSA